ncbi:hypothetical protein H0H92_012262 [Tricholoma furcatifolium]|nr:hypothetical protein H0H92_012262 [Tricholoma furcatifolium]
MRGSKEYDPHISKAIQRIRGKLLHTLRVARCLFTPEAESGRFKIIALTNNFAKTEVPAEEAKFLGWDDGATPRHLRSLFDDFCDSSALGMRKPEPEFYLLACKRNGIQPGDAVFLDDIGLNLKAAKALGMDTIRTFKIWVP